MKKEKIDTSPEFRKVLDSIDNWIEANNKRVSFTCTFVVFSEDFDIIDKDFRLMAYGPKELCKTHLGILKEKLEKEKDDFVNW